MRDKEEARENSWLVRLIVFLGLVALVFIILAIVKETYRKKQIQKEISALEEEAKKIQVDNSRLADKLTYLEGRDYQEKEIRDKLNLQSPEENVVIVKSSPTGKAATNNEKNQAPESQKLVVKTTNPEKWWNYFFKY
ncbi:MAG: septum formation initiator family protein [Candidatus Moraniibacteriota bacterium]|jgi:cell division protein FtsB